MNTLVGIDLQEDFFTGRLANPKAQERREAIKKKIREWDGPVVLTQDNHSARLYRFSKEGCLPIHCCPDVDVKGWEIPEDIMKAVNAEKNGSKLVARIQKPTFGFLNWNNAPDYPYLHEAIDQAETITVIGLVSEICVIANLVILRAMYPNKRIIWDSTCSAGVPDENGNTPGHEAAKIVAKAQQIEVIE